MTARALKDALQRAEARPEEGQEQFAEIDARLAGSAYRGTPEELDALDEAERRALASEAEVDAAFATFRRA